jgi:putative mRNA 3-end processing factor
VASGDYKRDPDPSCEPFEVVPCDTFITEATFGTPKYCWDKSARHGESIYHWWKENASRGENSVLFGYSLGKTQRILAELAPFATRPILIHPAMIELTECYRRAGVRLAETKPIPNLGSEATLFEEPPLRGELILAPPAWLRDNGRALEQLGQLKTAFASGWMQGGGFGHGRGVEFGFVLSDHADWNDLIRTVQETGAEQVFVQHRSEGALVRHLRKLGCDAHPVEALTPKSFRRAPQKNLELFPGLS